jgi:predicted flap endonuclease-1-like 5' DNA nuclease
MAKLIDVEGIGEKFALKLEKAGIKSMNDLLENGATPAGRKEIAKNSGIADGLILEWVNRVDLFRIKGVGEEYSDLLEATGVDTVVELGKRKPENLFKAMVELNEAKKKVRKLPTLEQVQDWIAQAKKLPRKISY